MPSRRRVILALAAAGALLAGSCAPSSRIDTSPTARPAHISGYTDDGNSVPVRPGPALGQRLPTVNIKDRDGRDTTLQNLYRLGPIVVVFYRGGWCPYCTGHLTEWQDRFQQLDAMGVRLVAITPEKPDLAAQAAAAGEFGFGVYSDFDFQAADAFRLRFSMDEATRERYRGYGVDLAQTNAKGAWDLPAPGTFIVDVNGVVRAAWADWDYTKRADPDEVIAAAREVVRPGPTRTR